MEEKNCQILFEYLKSIVYDTPDEKPGLEDLESPYKRLGQGMEVLEKWLEEMRTYSADLSKGNLSGTLPSEENPLCMNLKNLHASLNHLTWQAKQVAAGDYSQQVSYLGEFSEAFNTMIAQLKEREDQLKAEKEAVEKQADILQSYNELLLELTRKQREWIIIVDVESKDIVYCNKRGVGYEEIADKEFCINCRNRLPFLEKILYWEDREQIHAWEACDGNRRYYRVTTFPLEWKKRRAYAHILMDVTDEKLEARYLKDKAYHDGLTGIYNRMYFEEIMHKILKEKEQVVLGYLDLDCLKAVNDHYGHGEGDDYILRFVSTVKKYFRTTDIFARIGGDEFCLILNNISTKVAEEKLDSAMREFQGFRDKKYIHGFSFGVTKIRGKEETRDLAEIIKEVDAAMYQCKRKNKELYRRQQEGIYENPGD